MREPFDIRGVVYPILAVIGLLIYIHVIIPNDGVVTRHDSWMYVLHFGLFFSMLWLLACGKFYQKRKLQLIALVLAVPLYIYNGGLIHYDYNYVIGAGADRQSNESVGNFIGDENRKGNFVLWDPYVFCGMPVMGSLMGSGPSQAQGMIKSRTPVDKTVSVGCLFAFLWLVLRFKKSRFETNIINKIKSCSTGNTEESILLFAVSIIVVYEIIIPCIYALFKI